MERNLRRQPNNIVEKYNPKNPMPQRLEDYFPENDGNEVPDAPQGDRRAETERFVQDSLQRAREQQLLNRPATLKPDTVSSVSSTADQTINLDGPGEVNSNTYTDDGDTEQFESRNKQPVFSEDDEPITEGAVADQLPVYELSDAEVTPYTEIDELKDYLREHTSVFTQLVDILNQKIDNSTISEEEGRRLLRQKIEVFQVKDAVGPGPKVKSEYANVTLWDHFAEIAQEHGVDIGRPFSDSGATLIAQGHQEQTFTKNASQPTRGLLARFRDFIDRSNS